MVERIVLTAVIIVLGVLGYRLLLLVQQRQAARGAQSLRGDLSERTADARSNRAALLVFTSPTCAPCKLQQIPIAERLASDWGERVELRVVDVTEQPEVASRFGVWSLPTTIVLDPGQQVVAVNQGVAGEGKLRSQIEPLL